MLNIDIVFRIEYIQLIQSLHQLPSKQFKRINIALFGRAKKRVEK